jgi:Transposase DDE domain
MADLGYFSLKKFGHWNECGAYWLSRLKSGTTIYDVEGNRVDLLRLLRAAGDGDVDLDVVLGAQEQVACRLVARRVPAAVADKRRKQLLHKSKRRGDRPSALSLQLAEWTILLTNVPRELLNVTEAVTLYRLRWQIEIVHPHYGRNDTLYHLGRPGYRRGSGVTGAGTVVPLAA